MSHPGTSTEPVRAKPTVDRSTQVTLKPELLNDSYIYVHCNFHNRWQGMMVRIWKSTYLIDHTSEARSKLIHAENITIAPAWTAIPDRKDYSFLLIFESLPGSCKAFDLLEDIPQAGGFQVTAVRRNQTDVYHVNIL